MSPEGIRRAQPGQVYEFTNTGVSQRLDLLLCEQFRSHSRAYFQRLIQEGCVSVFPAAREVKPALRVGTGSVVRLVIPQPRKVDLSPLDIPIEILYEDESLAVVDKPAGLAVHPAPDQSSQTLVNALLFLLDDLSSIGGEERPGIVHRLDKETSGVLVVAKDDFAHNAISAQFKERTTRKKYVAVVRGEPAALEGRIDLPLGRSYTHSKKQMVRKDGSGREAVTDYRVQKVYRGYALLEAYPQTGRTHQIRVHLASQKMPVACDKLYGREKRIYLSELRDRPREGGEAPIIDRQALHAASLTFRHPTTGKEIAFSSPLPSDMKALVGALETHRA